MEGHKPKLPRVVAGIAVQSLPLAPLEGFVLSRIDAVATLADIADLTSLEHSEVARIVDKLIGLGAVEWADGQAHLPRMSAKSVAPPRPASPRSSHPSLHVPTTEVPSARPSSPADAARAAVSAFATPPRGLPRPPVEPAAESALPSDGIELPHDRRRRIDDLYVALDLLDHYDVLGVPRRAAKVEVRAAYFGLSKAFHPDTAFRKNVGPYRAKMEAIFKRLTEAYEVLGKKKARDEYDAYLESIGETRDAEQALSDEHEVPPELRAPEPRSAPPPSAPPPSAPPPVAPLPSARSTPTEEGKRVARELLAKRFGTSGGRPTPPRAPEPDVAAPAPPRSKQEMLRGLTTSLIGAATHTGGVDRASRLIAEARDADQRGDLAGAVRGYRLVVALEPERPDLAAEHDRLAQQLAFSLADRYAEQATYEERHHKWAAAAVSWGKVVDGRPNDQHALERAAFALVEAKGDLHRARDYAQRAVDRAPESVPSRVILGRVFHAAGLFLNAKRELEVVQKLDPHNAIALRLLSEIASRT